MFASPPASTGRASTWRARPPWSAGGLHEAARAGRVDAPPDAVAVLIRPWGSPVPRCAARPRLGGPAPQPPAELLSEGAPWDDLSGQEAVIDYSAPTFVHTVFFAQGLDRARSVCRLVRGRGEPHRSDLI